MAIPPPDVFINVDSARMIDWRTAEVTFTHPACADPDAIRIGVFGWGAPDAATQWYGVRLGVQEMRHQYGVPACTGPVTTQTRRIDLRALIPDQDVQRGEVSFNEDSLYGYMKQLPMIKLEFDFNHT
jgi:hypothetical protein